MFRDAEDAFFASLSGDEREQLHALLSRLRTASEAAADPNC